MLLDVSSASTPQPAPLNLTRRQIFRSLGSGRCTTESPVNSIARDPWTDEGRLDAQFEGSPPRVARVGSFPPVRQDIGRADALAEVISSDGEAVGP